MTGTIALATGLLLARRPRSRTRASRRGPGRGRPRSASVLMMPSGHVGVGSQSVATPFGHRVRRRAAQHRPVTKRR